MPVAQPEEQEISNLPVAGSIPAGHATSGLIVAESNEVEAALARAIDRASAAERWDVVAQLARELEARRLAAAGNVVSINSSKRRR